MPATATELALAALDHLLSLVRDGVGAPLDPDNVGVVVPRAETDLPAVVVALEGVRLPPAGLGGTAGVRREVVDGAAVDVGPIESGRVAASFAVQVWATSTAEGEQIVRGVAGQALEGVVRQRDDAATNRRTVERLLRFSPSGLGPTGRPPAGTIDAGGEGMFVRRMDFAGVYERTVIPLAPAGPPIREVPVTYEVESGSGRTIERETIRRA